MSNTVKNADRDTVQIMLMMTESCNLSCRYCYEVNKSNRKMSYETAIKILNKEFQVYRNTNKKLVVQFFGGEPLLEFETIKKIYYYILSCENIKFEYCFTVTNGTLLNSEMKKWMYKHREKFICGLSLDGTKKIHDYNRSNSYDMIDTSFFATTWPNQKVKMTISPNMLNYLSEGVIHCHKLGFGVLCNLADGVEWQKESSDILKNQLWKLIQYYLDNPKEEVCSILKMPLLHVGLANRDKFPKWCGAGDHIHAYDTNGKLFPCQLFMAISTHKNIIVPEIKSFYSADVLPLKCKDCILFGTCPTCIGTNVVRGCDLFYHTDIECRNIKIQFLATSYLMYEKYKQGELKMSNIEEFVLLNGIFLVQNAFADL